MKKFEKIISKAKNICWYPSANFDLPTAYFVSNCEDTVAPDLFIFSDIEYRNLNLELGLNFNYYRRGNFKVESIRCSYIEQIDNYEFGPELTLQGNLEENISSPIFDATFIINENSNFEDTIEINVLLIGSYNESFCANFLVQNNIKINTLIYKRPAYNYGDRFMSGLWIFNTIPILKVKYLATDIENYEWNKGDDAVINLYPILGAEIKPPYYLESENTVILKINNEKLRFENLKRIDMYPDFTIKKTKVDNHVINSTYFGINRLLNNVIININEIRTIEIHKRDLIIRDIKGDDQVVFKWQEANSLAEELNNGWRLPTSDEILEIYNQREVLNFANYGFWGYWTSEENGVDGYCFGGPNGEIYTTNKESEFYVRLVRDIE